MSARKILFIDHAGALGGAQHSLLLLLPRLGAYGWQPHLACTLGAVSTAAQEAGIPVHTMALPRLRRSARFGADLLLGVRALALLAGRIRAEVLYANTVRAAVYSALAAKISRRPLVWHMRDFWLSEEEPTRKWMDRLGKQFLLATSARVIANSKAVAANLPDSDRLRVIWNGIDVSAFAPNGDGEPSAASLDVPQGAIVVGTVGRLRPWKGQHRFLRVARKVLDVCDDAYFVVAGGSPFDPRDDYPASLRQLARDLDLQNHVIFTGQLTDVRPALRTLDVFVHAGEPEPFGLVNVEAMAMGLPVVAFAHGALPEIVDDGKTGRLLPPSDETAMAWAIAALLNDPALRAHMGAAARERAVRDFSIDRTVGEVDQVLREMLAEKQ